MEEEKERNPEATAHYEDGVRDALRKVSARLPSRYRAIADDIARDLGVELGARTPRAADGYFGPKVP